MSQVGLRKINSGWEVDECKGIKVKEESRGTIYTSVLLVGGMFSKEGGNETGWMAWPLVYALPGDIDCIRG